VWQFVLVLLLVRREQGSLRWPVVKHALWLRAPQSPRTGRRGGRVWLLTLPLILAVAAKEELPKLPAPVDRDQGLFLQSVAGQEFFSGNCKDSPPRGICAAACLGPGSTRCTSTAERTTASSPCTRLPARTLNAATSSTPAR
jgi:hypothetical protein